MKSKSDFQENMNISKLLVSLEEKDYDNKMNKGNNSYLGEQQQKEEQNEK